MSCTVIAVPYTLAWVIGAVAAAAANKITESINNSGNEYSVYNNYGNEDCHTITAEHFMEKDFETPFADKNILIKTLTEHGATNITDLGNSISGKVENYSLSFTRNNEQEPYVLRISCDSESAANEKLDDLNSEYALNVQEDAYLHILDKLKENNMQIEEETVEDDNTIVLTVNIDN